MLLQDKIAVVTGASRGIGRLMEKVSSEKAYFVIGHKMQGYEKAIVDISKEINKKFEIDAIIPKMVSEIEKDGGKAKAIQCNVSDFEQAKEFFGGVVKEYGRID